MQSSLIGKIEKAKRYAQETDRVTFSEFSVKFRGENSDYDTSYKDGKWHCSCSLFLKLGTLQPYHGHGENSGQYAPSGSTHDTV